MDFGFFDLVERHGGDLAALYEDRLRLLEYADGAGFYAYHVAEHHGTPLSMAPSPSLLLAAAAQRTANLRLGPLCYILPLYDPLRLIEEICMLDQLSRGRLEVGIGRGVSNIELNFFGVEIAEARERFEETLEVLNLGFSNDQLSYEGKYHHYDNVPMELRPVQRPHPRYWYPTSSLESAAAVGRGDYETIFQGTSEHVAKLVQAYNDQSGTGGEARKVGVLRFVFVADTDEAARDRAARAYAAHEANLGHLSSWQGSGSRSLTRVRNTAMPTSIDEAIATGWAAVGSPSRVSEQLAGILKHTGCNYLVFNPLLADVPVDFALRSVRLFAEEVMPRFAP